jgi:outer membrane protein assembly factor BamB
MLALDTKDGKVIWKKATDGWVWAGPALVENKLYFGDLMGVFYALNASDGSQIWKTEPETGSTSGISDRPLVIQGTIYFSSENGDLYAVDAAKGSVTWNKTIGGKLYGAPVQAGNLILVAPVGADSLVYAVDANGNQQWTFKPAKK